MNAFIRRSFVWKPIAFLIFIASIIFFSLAEDQRLARASSASEATTIGTTAMLSAASLLNATGTVIGPGFMPRCRESVIYIDWGAGVGSGGVTVETAHDPNYGGTWAPLVIVPWTAASKEDVVQITGIHGAIRTRISTVLAGGTVNTWILCN